MDNSGDKPTSSGSLGMLSGWSVEEKYSLLEALQANGYDDVKKIQRQIKTKSFVEVKEALDFYKEKADKQFQKQFPDGFPGSNTGDKESGAMQLMEGSAKLMTASGSFRLRKPNYAEVLRYGGTSKDIFLPEQTKKSKAGTVQMVGSVEGNPMPEDEMILKALLALCVRHKDEVTKACMRRSSSKEAVCAANTSGKGMKPVSNPDALNLGLHQRHHAAKRNCNKEERTDFSGNQK